MWRTQERRGQSAKHRLALARTLWRWEPHDAQKRLFCAAASVRIAACGRRWGKTESLSIDIATLALTEAGSRQLIVAPTEAQARLLGEAVAERLETAFAADPALDRARYRVKASPHLTLTVAESQILCRTAGRDGRNLRGLWAHRIIVDEAAHVPDRVLREVLPPMLADKGGEYTLASSPNGRRSAFYALFALGMAPPQSSKRSASGITYQSFQCPTTDNQAHLDRAWLRSQREEMGELLYAQEFEAQFLDDFGMVFREEDIDAALTEFADVRLDNSEVVSDPIAGRYYVAGIDWGRKYDYSVVTILDADAHPLRLVHLSRWRGTSWETQAADAAQIIARFRPRRVLADGNSIGDPIAEMLDAQIRRQMPGAGWRPTVERFTFGPDSKQQLIDRLNVGLAARAVQFPPHRALVSELRNFEYAPGSLGRLKMAARVGGHDDCVIALALAFYAAPDPASLRPPGLGILLGSRNGLMRRE